MWPPACVNLPRASVLCYIQLVASIFIKSYAKFSAAHFKVVPRGGGMVKYRAGGLDKAMYRRAWVGLGIRG